MGICEYMNVIKIITIQMFYFFFLSTYLPAAMHLYLKIKIAATSVVKIATEMFVSSMRQPAGEYRSFSGTWITVPFPARQDQTIRFTSVGSICRNLYCLQNSISVVCMCVRSASDNFHMRLSFVTD